MVTVGIFPFKENSHGRTGNRTRNLMISSRISRQRPASWSSGLTYKLQIEPLYQKVLKSGIISIANPTRCNNVSNLFCFGMTLYMFRTVFPSIIRSSRLYKQQQAFASKQTAVSVWQTPVAVCTVLNSWWWTERPSETCRVSFQNKINLIHWYIWLVLL